MVQIKLPEIFVGRKTEISELEDLWDSVQNNKEHRVYVYLNTPGIGKTTLIQKFGGKIEEGKGLFFSCDCTRTFSTREDLSKYLMGVLKILLKEKQKHVIRFIDNNVNSDDFLSDSNKEDKEDFKVIYGDLSSYIKNEEFTIGKITDVLIRLSNIIPIFFSSDEIQDFEKQNFPETETEKEETVLHYYTRILKQLMRSRILMLLSGTQYRILRQIGTRIGSPIRDKTEDLTITLLKQEEIIEYTKQLRKYVETEFDKPVDDKLWDNYERYLLSFSGGHGRTIEWISKYFLKKIDILDVDFNKFAEKMYRSMKEQITDKILRSDYKVALTGLQSSNQFTVVKNWISKAPHETMKLGSRPMFDNQEVDSEIERVIFSLVTLGILVKNGDDNYYVTSYFHLITFLETVKTEYEVYLSEILRNKFYRLFIGNHAGLGYNFETILLTSFLVKPNKIFIFDRFNEIERVDEIIDNPQPDIIYHTPSMKGFDAYFVDSKTQELVLVQITTQKDNLKQKFDDYRSNFINLIHGNLILKGWFVSLFPIEYETDDITITADKDLIPVLGESVFKRIKEIKSDF